MILKEKVISFVKVYSKQYSLIKKQNLQEWIEISIKKYGKDVNLYNNDEELIRSFIVEGLSEKKELITIFLTQKVQIDKLQEIMLETFSKILERKFLEIQLLYI